MPDYCYPVLRTEGLRNRVDRLEEEYHDIKEGISDDRAILDSCIIRVNSHTLRFNTDKELIKILTKRLDRQEEVLKALLEVSQRLLRSASKAEGTNFDSWIDQLTDLFGNLTLNV